MGSDTETGGGMEEETDTEQVVPEPCMAGRETDLDLDVEDPMEVTVVIKKLKTLVLLATISGSCAALVFACFWLFDKRMYG